jgi:lipopolysaccharide/colanic/teichoic acid biosynthesis glycosyltransferase
MVKELMLVSPHLFGVMLVVRDTSSAAIFYQRGGTGLDNLPLELIKNRLGLDLVPENLLY